LPEIRDIVGVEIVISLLSLLWFRHDGLLQRIHSGNVQRSSIRGALIVIIVVTLLVCVR
jgi:hypothetical protein